MAKKDLGLGDNFQENEKRLFNKDGTFNVRKIGLLTGIRDIYVYLTEISWSKFIPILFVSYFALNLIFAFMYYLIGVENLSGATKGSEIQNFMSCLYFSSQTFTTVGYGTISPTGISVNLIASVEAMVGLLSFSLATGLLFGRFARPNLKLKFSENILISPYGKSTEKGLMFRITNRRDTTLLETSAQVIATTSYQDKNGKLKRDYARLDLEISEIKMFPSIWTIVHPIDENSIFAKYSLEELIKRNIEVLVMIKSHDESYGRAVYARTSFKGAEIVNDAKFKTSSLLNAEGELTLDINTIGEYLKV